MVRTKLDTRVFLAFAIGLMILAPRLVGADIAVAQAGEDANTDASPDAEVVGQVVIQVESAGAVTSRSMANDLEAVLLDIQQTVTTVVGARPAEPLLVRFGGGVPETNEWIGIAPDTWVNADATVAFVDLDAWLALPELEATNRFRQLIARRWLVDASDAGMPTALLDGFARYLESPVLAEQARRASLVQQTYLDGELPGWSDMLASTGPVPGAPDEAVSSRHIALAAFLVERYGANVIADLATEFSDQPDLDPVAIVVETTGQTVERLDASWDEFLASWFAGGWRANLFSALDLQPAEDLFARGAYEAAVDRANRTLLLTTALDDRVGSAEAERVAAQGSVGMQAEALMADAEEALRDHDYGRALVLIERAGDQYALLPEDHRPGSLIESWRGLATDGAEAIERLDQARADSADWFLMRGAREDAIEAGSTFASLGDAGRVDIAQQLVDDLDGRLFRLVLALGGVTVLLVTWLLVWGWNRAPGRIRWPGTFRGADREAAI